MIPSVWNFCEEDRKDETHINLVIKVEVAYDCVRWLLEGSGKFFFIIMSFSLVGNWALVSCYFASICYISKIMQLFRQWFSNKIVKAHATKLIFFFWGGGGRW